jgi:hypothetical protein
MRRLATAALAAFPLLCGCFPPPLRLTERQDPNSGSIMMSVAVKGDEFPYFLRHYSRELFFSKVNPDGSFDPVLIRSTWKAGDRQYALGLTPGRYALVAAAYYTGRTRQLSSFSEDQSRAWITTVKPGEITFGGAILLMRPFPGPWDAFVIGGFKRLRALLPPFHRAVIPVTASVSRTDRTPAIEVRALYLALEDLKGTYWTEAVKKRLSELGSPPPPIMEGKGRKARPVPRKRAEFFTWMETLGWGPPRKIDGGLEFREPKSGATVSVAFFPKEGPRAASLDAELARLREAGSQEDRHMMTDIMVSSRPAQAIRYTTYIYPQASLVGSELRVLKTEAIVVPVKPGYYRLQYRADRDAFEKHRPEFVLFSRYLDFAPPPPLTDVELRELKELQEKEGQRKQELKKETEKKRR